MKMLNKINDKFYSYFDKETTMLFTFKRGPRGALGRGEAWFLSVTYEGAKQGIATFSVKDDGCRTYKEDYLSRLWRTEDALKEADAMVCKMLGI